MASSTRHVSRVLKWSGLVLGGLLLLMIVSGIALYFLFDWNWVKGSAIARLSAATGRKIEINGDIKGEWSLVPGIRLEDIRIANADWAKDPYMASIGTIAFHIKLLDLLRGRVTLPDLVIDKADIRLEKNKDGTPNWKFGPSVAGAAAESAVPETRTEFPFIGLLSIDHSQLIYRDPTKNLDLKTNISLAEGSGGSNQQIRLVGNGAYQNQPVKLNLQAASLLQLREASEPYPLKLLLDVGATHIGIEGTVTDPLNPEAFDVTMDLQGKNLADLFPIFRVPLPPTADYSLSGRFRRNGTIWDFTGVKGRVGGSDLSGNIRVDSGPKRPVMNAKLVSSNLDFKDLGGFIGAPPNQETKTKDNPTPQPTSDNSGKKAGQRVLPDVPIDLDRLHAMDMVVDFEGKKIEAPHLPLENLKTRLTLNDGLLVLDPLAFGVAGGTLGGKLTLDGRNKVPAVDTNLTLSNIGLKPFFQETKMVNVTSGKIGGNIILKGNGHSLADVLGTSTGRLTIAMTGGTLDPLLVELIGLDIGQALLVLADPPKPIQIRCALSDLKVDQGVADINALVIDTTDSNIWATGRVDFKSEKMDVFINADPKDVSLVSANAPIAVSGSLGSPDIAVDPTHTSDKGGIAEALGAIINPVIALLPFVDLGLGEDTDCRHFEKDSKKPVPSSDPKAVTPVPKAPAP